MDDYSFRTTSNQNNCWKRIVIKLKEWPWFIWFISIVELIVFIAQLGVSWSLTGSPIQIKPSFNPLIGPSAYVSIYMGARFAPCMYAIKGFINDSFLLFPCPNYTGANDTDFCNLNELCGFGGVSSPPNQWYRFIIAIFLHGGFLHIAVNIAAQLVMGIPLERKIGSLRLAIIYFISGIFGNIFSGNFAPNGSTSVGCSGSLFGIIALYLLNLLFDWHNTSCCQLICFIIGIIVDLVLGLLPLIDNFSHVGGFIMGILLGLVLCASPDKFRHRKENPRDLSVGHHEQFKTYCCNRSKKWWIWCTIRLISLTIAIIILILSILNIYLWKLQCNWCQYIDCLPVNGWCESGHLENMDTITSTLITTIDSKILYTSSQL